jgi:hypothetical protein
MVGDTGPNAQKDVRWATGSFVLTAALVWLHTGSLFLAIGGRALHSFSFLVIFSTFERYVEWGHI